ncbi:universal stress protein [Desulfobacula sp.]|uniref:universal stress protein n=1 Tax=Desulfobacula sp. TaxID=2593537 RepID=UPI0026095DC9|nr:universal stress protein [Desulfobacula sp.]
MKTNINKILFTTDLSSNSRYAFNYAASIAGHYGASIVILHVMENIPQGAEALISGFLGEDKMNELAKANEQNARSALIGKKSESMMIRQALDALSQDTVVGRDEGVVTDEIIVTKGDVAEEIINQANDCDMIIMAYRSRNMLADTIVGDHTRRVLRRSKKPVLLVPMPDEK